MTDSDNGFSGPNDIDPAFTSIPKNKSALCIWRVENFKLVAVPRESHGTFFKGDAYVVYHGEETKKSSNSSSSSLVQHIHFWIGSESTQDEAGVAAYKTVELDDYLSGNAVQHREVQGNESERFLSYFKSRGGVTYRQGGVASGFHRHQINNEPRLFRLKGRHNVRLFEMPSIDWSLISRGDVYILDLYEVIFIWNGSRSNKYERLQAMQRARQLRDERGKANIVIIEDGEETKMAKEEFKLFESKLPLKDKMTKLNTTDTIDENDDDKRVDAANIKLYKCSDESGTLKVTEKKAGPLFRSDLESEDAYILDNGAYGIWVWVGRRSNPKERREAMRNALGFLQKKAYPKTTKVCRVIDGGEPMEFIALFNNWIDSHAQKGLGKTYTKGNIAKITSAQFDATIMHSQPQLAAAAQMPDDGSGKKEIFRIEQFKMVPYPESMYGIFFAGDSFVIQYTYQEQQSSYTLIYFWLGHHSSQDEQGAAAIAAVELDKRLNGAATIIRVVQDKEPLHFMAMFQGRMIIFKHGKRSGFRNYQHNEENTSENDDSYLLQVRGLSKYDTKAVQVDFRASSLNSNDCFVLFSPEFVFTWCGKGSTGDEREMAKVVASSKSSDPIMVFEGQEKEDFWKLFPHGKEAYATEKRLAEHQSPLTGLNDHPARLFEISNATGRTTAIEIPNFTQSDLDEDDVMLLDAWTSIFLWIGRNANKTELRDAERIAYDYLRTDPSHRDLDTPVIKTKQMHEPIHFIGFFGPWDRTLWTGKSSYEIAKSNLISENRPEIYAELVREKPKQNIINRNNVKKYPYDILLKPADELPEDVNPEVREIHLTDEEFVQRFKMSYAEYSTKPVWKQKELKKQAKLF